jgi:NADPH:quinone reductase-like Zn-dependent oxidoreductase
MRAVVRDRYGSADVLRVAQVPVPAIADREVLVRVRAAGLDRGTWHLMTGKPYALRLAFGLRRPRNPVAGREVAGTVVAVGSAVTRFSPGDDVFGIAPGSFAEYAVAPEAKLARKPATLDFAQSAVLSISGLTAFQALADVGRVEPGQHVLVLGASGGVGSFAVLLAKALGAEVTGVCSTAKLELVRSLGADHVIDYTRDDFADGAQHYDLILDIAGNPSVSRLRRALAPRGTAVLMGGEEGGSLTGGMGRQVRALVTSFVGRQRLTGMLCKERASDLERLAELVDSSRVVPLVDSTYPLERSVAAMRELVAGRVGGKIAITV